MAGSNFGTRASAKLHKRLLDTFDSVLNGHILYYYLVTNYLNPLAIMTPVWYVI